MDRLKNMPEWEAEEWVEQYLEFCEEKAEFWHALFNAGYPELSFLFFSLHPLLFDIDLKNENFLNADYDILLHRNIISPEFAYDWRDYFAVGAVIIEMKSFFFSKNILTVMSSLTQRLFLEASKDPKIPLKITLQMKRIMKTSDHHGNNNTFPVPLRKKVISEFPKIPFSSLPLSSRSAFGPKKN
jgi:hypothetical protein